MSGAGEDEGSRRLTSERAGRDGAPEGGWVDGRRGRWGGGPVIGDGTEVERRHDFGMGKGDEASRLAFMPRSASKLYKIIYKIRGCLCDVIESISGFNPDLSQVCQIRSHSSPVGSH